MRGGRRAPRRPTPSSPRAAVRLRPRSPSEQGRCPGLRRGTMGAMPPLHLPMTRAELDARGIDAPDVVLVTGDAYVDHPSFAMAILGRWLESLGYSVAILAQPDWRSADPWRALGRPRLFYGVS